MREHAARLAAALPDRLLVGGRWVPATGRAQIEAVDPANGSVIRRLTGASAADVGAAVAAAHATAPRWERVTRIERARLLERLADAIEARADDLAALDALDNGKPFRLARAVDLVQSVAHLRYQASVVRSRSDRVLVDARATATATVTREPAGVVALITPWNYPTLMIVRALAPALAAGNTVVVKPAELTPLSALLLGEIIGGVLPDGVVNIVTGSGAEAGAALAAHPDVDLVVFTGSPRTAATIRATSSARTIFELGGKAPVVILEDADLDAAVAAAVAGAFGNQGQNCMAATRILVARPLLAAAERALADAAAAVVVGDGFDETTMCGPLVSAAHRTEVHAAIDRAIVAGAEVVTGGEEWGHAYLRPTLLRGVARTSEAWRREIFGPVTLVDAFDDIDEAVALANDTRYGLAASVWSADAQRAAAVARGLRTGVVWVNTYSRFDAAVPFAPRGDSGTGVVGGVDAFESYSALKSTWTLLPDGAGA